MADGGIRNCSGTARTGQGHLFGALPPELLSRILQKTAAHSRRDAASALLVCKQWARTLQPNCCVLLAAEAPDPPGPGCVRNALTPRHPDPAALDRSTDKVLASRFITDAVVCGGAPWPAPFARWTRLSCLQLCCLPDTACVASLSPGLLRALRLHGLRFDVHSLEALRHALLQAAALEHLTVESCSFPDGEAGLELLEPLRYCGALRFLEGDLRLDYAALPQLSHFGCLSLDSIDASTLDLALGSSITSLTLTSCASGAPDDGVERQLVRLLTANATVAVLTVAIEFLSDQLLEAFASMKSVNQMVCCTQDPRVERIFWGESNAALTDLHLRLPGAGSDMSLRRLFLCTNVTSLVLGVGSRPSDLEGEEAHIGRCTNLRRLRLIFDTRNPTTVRYLLESLCDQAFSELRALTSLELPGDQAAIHPAVLDLIRASTPATVTWTGDRAPDTETVLCCDRVPLEYRLPDS